MPIFAILSLFYIVILLDVKYYLTVALICYFLASPVMQWQGICLLMQKMQETCVYFLNPKDPLEKEIATHSSIPAWKIPWTVEPGGLPYVYVLYPG